MPADPTLVAAVWSWLQQHGAFLMNDVVLAATWLVWKARVDARHARALEGSKAGHARTLERVKVDLASRSRHAEAILASITEVLRALANSIDGRGSSPAQVFPELEACREKLVQAELALSLSFCVAARNALDEWEEIAASALAAMLPTATTRVKDLDRQRLHERVGASAARLTAMLRNEANEHPDRHLCGIAVALQ